MSLGTELGMACGEHPFTCCWIPSAQGSTRHHQFLGWSIHSQGLSSTVAAGSHILQEQRILRATHGSTSRKMSLDAAEQHLMMDATHTRVLIALHTRFLARLFLYRPGPAGVHSCLEWCVGHPHRASLEQKRVCTVPSRPKTDLIFDTDIEHWRY